jgi:hypothetical protein
MEVGARSRDMFEWDMELVMDGNLAAGLAQGAAYHPALRSMKFEFKDASLNKRIDEHCAALGLSKEEIVQARLDALAFFGEAMGIVSKPQRLGVVKTGHGRRWSGCQPRTRQAPFCRVRGGAQLERVLPNRTTSTPAGPYIDR